MAFGQIPYGQIAVMGATAQALQAQQTQKVNWFLVAGIVVAFLALGRSRGSRSWH
jgi:hypothetical protein